MLTANAYIEQSQIQILLKGPGGPVKCNRGATVTATVVSTQDGKPVRKIQIADEPTASLDSVGQRQVLELLGEIQSRREMGELILMVMTLR